MPCSDVIGNNSLFVCFLLNIPVLLKLIVVHSLINLPIVFGIIETGWRNVPQSVIDAAKVDGASAMKWVSKIAVPMMRNYIFTAFVYSFTISVGETSGTLTLAEPPITTFSAVVFRLMSSRNTEIAMALNTFYFAFVVSLFINNRNTEKGGTCMILFGTGGIRGIMREGEFDEKTVAVASKGVAEYMKINGLKKFVAYDTRNNSEKFAKFQLLSFHVKGWKCMYSANLCRRLFYHTA